ncbi:uncharacterized protein PV06_04807 [Exophiala oligosperma]|uniref:Thioredoxin domain-containing protein n=2 Tax=Chaetothyriales TaxID=34395 RepID=A0A0D2DMN6_9EURO|nr:uncharacterized protein PV06_04807 [Exophiala oligosperma]KAJ9621381.1 hypothetical protein H2204_011942 [Knufia peltigerae]KIW43735.1 hypothetical protein PV06_04807 [Exophiala oligosperma]
MAVQELTILDSYRAELDKPGLVVIDFYSTQCPPCKVIAPLYDAIANKYSNKDTRFFKVNGLVEPGGTIQREAEVVWWPTLVVYRDGREAWRAKVPNPPSIEPVRELERLLDEQSL